MAKLQLHLKFFLFTFSWEKMLLRSVVSVFFVMAMNSRIIYQGDRMAMFGNFDVNSTSLICFGIIVLTKWFVGKLVWSLVFHVDPQIPQLEF